jgi:hypothetical protein
LTIGGAAQSGDPADSRPPGLDSAGTEGNKSSYLDGIALSADGQVVAFASDATNLEPNDGNNAVDVFAHDRPSGVTTRVSLGLAGADANGDCSQPGALGRRRARRLRRSATNSPKAAGSARSRARRERSSSPVIGAAAYRAAPIPAGP